MLIRWHEWINRKNHPHIALAMLQIASTSTYNKTITHLRTNRPRGGSHHGKAGARFWDNTNNRAHLILAILARPEPRTIQHITESINLPDSKIYQYFRRWNINYKSFTPRPWIEAIGRNNRTIRAPLYAKGDTYLIEINGRYHPVNLEWGTWRILHDPGPEASLTLTIKTINTHQPETRKLPKSILLAHLDAWSRDTTGFPATTGNTLKRGTAAEPYIPVKALKLATSRTTVEKASRHLNKCKCIYWDDTNLKCGLVPSRPPIPEDCPDFTPLPPEKEEQP